MDRTLYDLRELINKELDEIISKGTLTPEALCNVDKAVDILKDIHEIEGGEENEYSEYMPYYDRRGSYARRDARGRYSRGHDSTMIEHLEDMMHKASNEKDREMIRKWMAQAENV